MLGITPTTLMEIILQKCRILSYIPMDKDLLGGSGSKAQHAYICVGLHLWYVPWFGGGWLMDDRGLYGVWLGGCCVVMVLVLSLVWVVVGCCVIHPIT